jgi:hypothetical protein
VQARRQPHREPDVAFLGALGHPGIIEHLRAPVERFVHPLCRIVSHIQRLIGV